MDKGVLACVMAVCATSGAFFGIYTDAMHDESYVKALNNPDFFYLVDNRGNPVSQEVK